MSRPLRPLTGIRPTTRHLLLWIEPEVRPARGRRATSVLLPGSARLWGIEDKPGMIYWHQPVTYDGPDTLRAAAQVARQKRYGLTLWLVRGWTDFVLSGLSRLIDDGRYKWTYAMLDGAKVIFRGKLDGSPLAITSLACWTGHMWSAWKDDVLADPKCPPAAVDEFGATEGEKVALRTVGAILDGGSFFETGPQRLSIAGQARSAWRTWLGPGVLRGGQLSRTGQKLVIRDTRAYVAPLPDRPAPARLAERHSAYALPYEQFVHGHVAGKVYCVDLCAAYLSGLMTMPTPVCWASTVGPLAAPALAQLLEGHTGCALVRLDTPDWPYPVRIMGRTGRAVGHFWTWLAGGELARALSLGHVRECQTFHRWHATKQHSHVVDRVLYLGVALKKLHHTSLGVFWRALYSSLIGSWAQWQRHWVDEEQSSPFGRWATWTQFDPQTGELVRYRSIGGRVQKRLDREDAPHSVPLMYACVTAQVRAMMGVVMELVPRTSILAVSADSYWFTEAGFQIIDRGLERLRGQGIRTHLKAVYEEAWLDGHGHAIVKKEGKLYPVMTGVPATAEMGPDGRSVWVVTEPWNAALDPSPERGVRTWQAGKRLDKYIRALDYPPVPQNPWHVFQDGMMREELLQPLTRKGQPPHEI